MGSLLLGILWLMSTFEIWDCLYFEGFFFEKAHFIPKLPPNDVQFLDWELFKRLSSSSSNPWNKLCTFECLISYLWLSHTYIEILITCLHLCHYHLKMATHHLVNNKHVIFMDIPTLIPVIITMTILLGLFATCLVSNWFLQILVLFL